MTVNSNNVFVGAPDQATTGAILSGDAQATVPETIDDFILTALTDSGYVSEDGVTLTPEESTESIRDWSRAEIRRVLSEFNASIAWTHLELSAGAARTYFGDDNVEVTAADATHGERTRMALGAGQQPVKGWYFKIKDGQRRVLIYVPKGMVSERGEIPINATAAISLPVTLATLPDEHGKSIYIFTDNGIVESA